MKQRLSLMFPAKRVGIAIAAIGLSVVVLGTSLASGSPPAQASAGVATIYIKGSKTEPLHFVAPKTITEGEKLRIVNETNPKQVGPHTFSLVEESEIPKTKKEQKACFTANHICKAIAGWHGVHGKGAPTVNPVEAGLEGWSTQGSLKTKGDSWFTGTEPKASFEQRVNAGATAGPVTLTFMCAIHPWMHGKITVLPVE